MFEHVINTINVPRPGGGRARSRPDAVMGDKAYYSRVADEAEGLSLVRLLESRDAWRLSSSVTAV